MSTHTDQRKSKPFDTERFISEIQKRPYIWNMSIEEYNNRELKKSGWNKVADILYGDWKNLDENTKKDRIRELQKKWKGLRDYHAREKNKDFSLRSEGKKRKTPFLDMLQFLNVCRGSNQTPSNNAIFDENDSAHSAGNFSKKMRVVHVARPKSMEIKRDTDPNMHFLLNILPEMKTMSPAQNFEFRFEVMKLIKNIKYNDSALMQTGCTNAYNYPHQYDHASGSSPANVQDYPSDTNNYNPVGSSIRSPRDSPSHSSTGFSVELEDTKEGILPDASDNMEDDE